MKVYLSGPIQGLSWDRATNWREWAKREFDVHGINAYSPLRGKEYLNKEDSIAKFYSRHILSTQKAIYTRDRYDTKTSDVVLVNLVGAKVVSIGTVIEIAWADSESIPIILAMEEGNIHEHAILQECCGIIVPTLEEAVAITIRFLLP